MIETEAWVLHVGESELRLETISFPEVEDDEVLVEPLLGCWEANMTHALQHIPVDVCRQRREKKVVLGNAGVVRVLQTGPKVTKCREGDICGLVPIGESDPITGALVKVLAYDCPGTMGILAKRAKLREDQIVQLPKNSKYSLDQWAAFNLRYCSAWSNWKVAYPCWRASSGMPSEDKPTVWAWGGGVALAELHLAQIQGCRTAMIASHPDRIELLRQLGITPVERGKFSNLRYDPEAFPIDRPYRAKYLAAERVFLDTVDELTDGKRVSIFIDNIGTPVSRATIRALARHGVVATCGWKEGYDISLNRAVECMSQRVHVHTHGCRRSDGIEARDFAETHGWMPSAPKRIWNWESIPQLAEEYAAGMADYFPLYQVNQV
jgi:NADPH:quinone reductase-like Zn-dependent oxidoreductase